MPRSLKFIALLAAAAIAGCGGKSNNTPQQPLSKLPFRAFVASNLQKALYIIDETRDQIYTINNANTLTNLPGLISLSEGTLGVAASPVALVTAGTGITLAVTHDSFGDGISIVDNAKELQTAAVGVAGPIVSTVAGSDGKTAYAAIPSQGQLDVIDIATAKITASVAVSNVTRLVISPDNSKVLAFSPNRAGFTLLNTSDNSIQTVSVVSAIYGVFSSDNTKAYILSCSAECGASTPASVTVVDVSAATPGVGAAVTVPAATVGLLDSSGNLFVAGSPTVGPGAGVLTVVNTSSMSISKTVSIGDGNHNLMVASPSGKLYIGAKTCTEQINSNPPSGCLSIYNISAGTAVIDAARGDVTGIQPVTAKGRNVVYITVGGVLIIYDGATDAPQNVQIPITGTVTDVKSAQ